VHWGYFGSIDDGESLIKGGVSRSDLIGWIPMRGEKDGGKNTTKSSLRSDPSPGSQRVDKKRVKVSREATKSAGGIAQPKGGQIDKLSEETLKGKIMVMFSNVGERKGGR